MDDPVRVRVVFEDRRLLTKSQRLEGLRKCWLLLRPECANIADLADHVASRFGLRGTSSDGLMFLMDEFVLPSSESTCIFRDKDIIRVRKKTDKKEFIKVYDDAHYLHNSVIEKQPILHNSEHLAIKESQEDVREHRSRNEDDQYENQKNAICQGSLISEGMETKRKRKSLDKLQGSKTKKLKAISEQLVITTEDNGCFEQNPSCSLRRGSTKVKLADRYARSNALILPHNDIGTKEASNPATTVERNEQIEENSQINTCKVHICDATKKLPSRSARRKKAKRQLRREKDNNQLRKNLQSHVLANALHCTSSKYQAENHNTEGEEIVPVTVRPGHIRFEPLEQSHLQPNGPVKTFHWDGTTSKKKGQKWGRKKTIHRRNDDNCFRESASEKLANGEGKIIYKLLDFESLFPLTRLPKEGDVIVYRLVEVSSWCPELSPIRVGKVLSYNYLSKKIILVPVPEYPIFCTEEKDAEGSKMQPGISFYKQDGSLEIEYPSLVDVRLLKESGSGSTTVCSHSTELTKVAAPVNNRKAASGKHVAKIDNWEAALAKNGAKDSGISPADWDQISQIVNEDAELQSNGWGKWIPNKSTTTTTTTSTWSYRAPRGTSLGPKLQRKNGKSGGRNYNSKFSK